MVQVISSAHDMTTWIIKGSCLKAGCHILVPTSSSQIADTRMAGLMLPARLADFIRVQRVHRDEISDQLASDWTMKVGGRCVQITDSNRRMETRSTEVPLTSSTRVDTQDSNLRFWQQCLPNPSLN